jgi:hypothetical protein
MGVTNMDKCLQFARNITISRVLCLQASNNPEANSYAAVMVITPVDDEGSISLDRSNLAPGLTERLS